MSWSISYTGKPANIRAALEAHAEKTWPNASSEARKEFEGALPTLLSILGLNSGDDNHLMQLRAAGHSYDISGSPRRSYFTCALEGAQYIPV